MNHQMNPYTYNEPPDGHTMNHQMNPYKYTNTPQGGE
jgi:hypothetical protein